VDVVGGNDFVGDDVVGASEGKLVGETEGSSVGDFVGENDGNNVGASVG